MSDPTLEEALSAYLAQPVTGERLGATYQLSIGLVGVLQRLAAERGVPVDALVEHMLFKAVRADNARLMVGEKPDTIPSSFLDDRVARAKAELRKDVEAVKALQEQGGDKALRVAGEMERVLEATRGGSDDAELDDLQRKIAEADARVDMALERKR